MVKNLPANAGDTRDAGLIPELGRSPAKKWQPTAVFLPGESHGQRCLVGRSPWGHKKKWDKTEQLSTHTRNIYQNAKWFKKFSPEVLLQRNYFMDMLTKVL